MTSVLLLNASYEPLRVVPPKRAIVLLLLGKAVPATDDVARVMRSASGAWPVPAVVRLRRYINVPRRGARWSRKGVLQRDGYRCIYCGVQVGEERAGRTLTKADFSVDHIIPRSKGGRSTWGNTACACAFCNRRKGGRTPHEAGMRLLWEPKTPRTSYLVVSGEVPASWKFYLPRG